MKAIRKIVKTEDNMLNISLPADFCHKTLELIILPYDNGNVAITDKESTSAYRDFILNIPVMDDQQYAEWETDKSNLYSWLKS